MHHKGQCAREGLFVNIIIVVTIVAANIADFSVAGDKKGH